MSARFGIKVLAQSGPHVHFLLYAATGGQHLGGCGRLCMRVEEYEAFRALLEPQLVDRSDVPADLEGTDSRG